MPETYRLLKRFALIALLALCVTAMACGALLADANTRFLSLGEPGARVGVVFDKETVTLTMNQRAVELPALSPALRWARYAPAPLGALVALGESIYALGGF